jgi:hypothetical protein
MIAQSGDGCASHFQVFACRIVFGDVRHRLITHPLLNCALASNGCLSRKLCAPSRLRDLTPTLLGQAASLGQALTLRE